jgi:hypothetical protein
MISLIFEKTNGEKVMLPVMSTLFEEKTIVNTTIIVAHFNGEKFELKTSLNEIQHMCAQVMRPPLQAPMELKNLRGF